MDGIRCEGIQSESGLLPIAYCTGGSEVEYKAFLHFTPEAIQVLEKEKSTEEMTVYDSQGVKIGLPAKYADQLIVQTEFDPSEYSETFGLPLIRVSEKASRRRGRRTVYRRVWAGFLASGG